MDVAQTEEQRQMLKVVLAPTAAGRPFLAPPSTPPDRVDALRNAFVAMASDAAFTADAAKLRIEVEPMSGPAIHALLENIYGSPPSLIEKVKIMLAPP